MKGRHEVGNILLFNGMSLMRSSADIERESGSNEKFGQQTERNC